MKYFSSNKAIISSNKSIICNIIVSWFIIGLCIPLNAQLQSLPKQIKENDKLADGSIKVYFKKPVKRDQFEEWCASNGYKVLTLRIEEKSKFGVTVQVVHESKLISFERIELNKKIRWKQNFIAALHEGDEIDCDQYNTRKPPILPKKNHCFICYDNILKEVRNDHLSSNSYWANGDGVVQFNHNNVLIQLASYFKDGAPTGDVTIKRSSNGNDGRVVIHLFKETVNGKDGNYIIFANEPTSFVLMKYDQGKATDHFYVYSLDSRYLGSRPIYGGDFGRIGMYSSSDTRTKNFYKSLEPILNCIIIEEASSYGDNPVSEAAIEQIVGNVLDVNLLSLQDFKSSVLQNQSIKELKESNHKNAAQIIEVIDFINCVISQIK